MCCYQMNKATDAIEDCTNAIELDDKYIKAYLRRAKWYVTEVFECSVNLKPSFHCPSSQPVNSGAFFDTRQLGCQKCTGLHGPSTRPGNSGSGNRALLQNASN